MPPTLLDDFNRSNELLDHGDWAFVIAPFPLGVVNNQLGPSTTGFCMAAWVTPFPAVGLEVELTVTGASGVSGTLGIGRYVSLEPGLEVGRHAQWDLGTGEFKLYEHQGSATFVLRASGVFATPASGDRFRVRFLQDAAGTVEFYVNDVLEATYAWNTNVDLGSQGFIAVEVFNGNTSGHADDLRVRLETTLAGAAGGAGTAQGSALVAKPLSAAPAPAAALAASVEARKPLAGAAAGTPVLEAALLAERALLGLLAAAGGLEGATRVPKALSGQAGARGRLLGRLGDRLVFLAGGVLGLGGGSASARLAKPLSGTIPALGGGLGTPEVGARVSGLLQATSGLAAALPLTKQIAGAVAASGAVAGLLVPAPPSPPIALRSSTATPVRPSPPANLRPSTATALGSVTAALSTLAAEVLVERAMRTTLSGASSLGGALRAGTVEERLSGAVAARAGASGRVLVRRHLRGRILASGVPEALLELAELLGVFFAGYGIPFLISGGPTRGGPHTYGDGRLYGMNYAYGEPPSIYEDEVAPAPVPLTGEGAQEVPFTAEGSTSVPFTKE